MREGTLSIHMCAMYVFRALQKGEFGLGGVALEYVHTYGVLLRPTCFLECGRGCGVKMGSRWSLTLFSVL